MKLIIKKILPKKILARLIIIFFVPLICVQVLMILLFYDRHWDKITTRFVNIASNQVNLILEDYTDNKLLDQKLSQALNLKTRIVTDKVQYKEKNNFNFVQKNIINTFKNRISYNHNVIFLENEIILNINYDNETIEISFPEKYLISETPIILFLWIVFSSVILSLIALLFLRIQVRAITRLARFSEEFGSGKDTESFKPEGAVEVRMAGNAFLKMKKRIKNQIKNRTYFLAGISHDLGTIITRLKLQIELANKISDVKEIKHDIKNMQTLLEEYLEYSKNVDTSEKLKKIYLRNFINQIIQNIKKVYKNNEIILDCNSRSNILFGQNNLYRIVSNILENACKFGKIIKVKAFSDDKKLIIDIEDDGPGIENSLKSKIFKPFFKRDSSRNLNQVGSGLGLSIAKEIIVKSGGRVVLKKSNLGGAYFKIILPLN